MEQGALVRDISKAVQLLARTVRSRPLYGANNKALERMMEEVVKAFDHLFTKVEEISLHVHPTAFVFDETPVFEEPNAEVSFPFLFFRDGVRRLELSAGLSREELEILMNAAAASLGRRAFDDDVVSALWRHHLEHVRYVTLDTTIVDAAGAGEGYGTSDVDASFDVDGQVDALLRQIYGGPTGDAAPVSLHLDASDLSAKALADALGAVDAMAPGLHPQRANVDPPAYAADLRAELLAETDDGIAEMASAALAEALAKGLDGQHQKRVVDAMLSAYDAAIIGERVGLARQIVEWAQLAGEERGHELMSLAMSEERIRQLAAYAAVNAERQQEVMAFLRASGRAAVPALVALVPSLTDPQQRRAFSDLAMQMGMEQVEPLLHLLQSEQGFVAAEALHMLAQLGQLDRRAARESLRHTKPQVRLALLQHVDRMDADVAEEVILELLDDREPRVRGEAVHLIGRCDPGHAKAAVEAAIAREGFEETSLPVKQAFLSAYVAVSGRAALDRLEEIIQETDRRLVRKPVEELAVAAVAAVAALPSSKSVTILKKACLSRNKAVRKLARAELSKVRKDFE